MSKVKEVMTTLISELLLMPLEELEAVKPDILAQLYDLSEPAQNAFVKALELVIEHKKAKLQATT